MSRTTSEANGGIAAELRDWAQGCYSTEAAVDLLIRTYGGRFAESGQPWLRTTTEESPGSTQSSSRDTRMPCLQENATFWHSSKPSQLASRSKMWAVSWPAWTHIISVWSLRVAACWLWQRIDDIAPRRFTSEQTPVVRPI
jgi:hypothetical protein